MVGRSIGPTLTPTRRDFIVGSIASAAATKLRILDFNTGRTTSGQAFWCIDNTANLDSNYYPYTAALESKLGHKFAGVRLNAPLESPWSSDVAKSYNLGRHSIYYNAKANLIAPDTATSKSYWKSIAAGRYDKVYLAFWQWATNLGLFTSINPLHYSPQHEECDEPPCAPGAGTAADFQAMFRHVHNLCVTSGYHTSVGGCIDLAFVPGLNQVQHDPVYGSGTPSSKTAPYQVSKMDPGPAYYERVGFDCYWKSTMGNLTAAQSFGPLVKWAKAVGKPWMTGEFGLDKSKSVATFLHDLAGIITSCGAGNGPGQCVAICGTSRVATGGDYRYDATTTTLNAWKTFAGQPFFGATV